uniref:Uncharacterized protein n=1 Tax=Arundo donax TaxID=35708 RepID=A0A0A9FHK6_ARUDO
MIRSPCFMPAKPSPASPELNKSIEHVR